MRNPQMEGSHIVVALGMYRRMTRVVHWLLYWQRSPYTQLGDPDWVLERDAVRIIVTLRP